MFFIMVVKKGKWRCLRNSWNVYLTLFQELHKVKKKYSTKINSQHFLLEGKGLKWNVVWFLCSQDERHFTEDTFDSF